MKIAVIGLGYIGLPTALMMASNDLEIIGVDYNSNIINTLTSGSTTFSEKGLDELFEEACQKGITFTTDYPEADIYIIAVPTPYDRNTKKIDPSYIVSAVKMLLTVAPKGAIVVVESTISPGVIDRNVRPTIEAEGKIIGDDVHLVHAPERIIPGNMIYELEHNSRTVGADDHSIAEKVKNIYARFCKGDILITDIRTAELSKVVENTFRDINIAFANELAQICREAEVDVHEVIRISNHHPRVNILSPGPGVGGHCIPVDPWFLVGDYPDLTNLIHVARKVNDGMPSYVLGRIKQIMSKHNVQGFSKVGLYGLTYKENVDDIRESPTLQLLEVMKTHGISDAHIYDPYIKSKLVPNQVFDFDEFIESSELVVILVAHNEIKDHEDTLENKIVLDTKHALTKIQTYGL